MKTLKKFIKKNKKYVSNKKFRAGALFSGKKGVLEPCSKGSMLKKSCGKDLECIIMDNKYKHKKDGKTYDGYCAEKGTTPESVVEELKKNKCEDLDCGEHGKCIVLEEGDNTKTNCECVDGYTGEKCEIAPDPCLNFQPIDHGKCVNDNGIAKYECMDGYTGEKCEIAPDPCLNFNCGEHGKCVNENGIAKCNCEDGYRGEKCEFEPVTVESRGFNSEVAKALEEPAAKLAGVNNLTNTGRLGAHMRNVKNSMVAMESTLRKNTLNSLAIMNKSKQPKYNTTIEKFCPPSTEKDSAGKPVGHPCKRCCSWESQPHPLSDEYKRCKDEGVANACKSEYTFEELSHIEPMDLRREQLELKLSDEEFQEKFGMDKNSWKNSRDWKKQPVLKKLKIYGGSRKLKKKKNKSFKKKTKLLKKKNSKKLKWK